MQKFLDEYIEFLSTCKTEREVIEYARVLQYSDMLSFARFFRDKCMFACRIKPGAKTLNLIAVHADSPRLDFKQNSIIEQAGLTQAKTHYYGGIRKYQWLARPLAIHGVAFDKNGSKISVNIGEDLGDPVFSIEDLLPHLAKKQVEQKVSEAFEGEKLNVILGSKKDEVVKLIYDKYELREKDLITAELEVVPAGPARYVGFDKSLIGGYGHDDRSNVFAAINAYRHSILDEHANIALIIWDKEEIGSYGSTGASSKFLQYCLEYVAARLNTPLAELMLQNTYALSADVLPALDPDYQDAHEKQNAAILGNGPAFAKYSGSRGKVGANDADAEYYSEVVRNFDSAGIKWQCGEIGKVDFGGGGTVSLHLASLGMRTIDFGVPVLSMHSPFELVNCQDLYETSKAFEVFYKTTFSC